MTSLKTSPITLQIVPLLMVGLGVNDFFVLASYMKSTIKKNPEGQLSRYFVVFQYFVPVLILAELITNSLCVLQEYV